MRHQAFILSPLTKIVEETVTACYGIGDGINTSSISEHVFQSLFLRMTGAQEQKMKCICWDMATYDYEYRYDRYSKDSLGECSNYSDKKKVINDIIDNIKKEEKDFDPLNSIDLDGILSDLREDMDKLFKRTNLSIWRSQDFWQCSEILTNVKKSHLFVRGKKNKIEIFKSDENNGIGGGYKDLQEIYKKVYRHRNRCAHNTLSYQENLPTLKTLSDEDYIYENYFLRYAILILIDKITITLYNKYLEVMGMQT